ncbi:Alpha/Beta hydrolase protein [Xylaria arbuscula]|nr:Alpha/Beta hydrolase protein [Xylaria arbuscula]
MAAPGSKYFIQDKLAEPAAHHAGFKALWETKWKPLCDKGIYPFMYGTTEDFEPVVNEIIAAGLKPPYNWDEYASFFFPHARSLADRARDSRDDDEASELYMRASALYRIARFPAPRSENQRSAWRNGKLFALAGLRLQKYPMVEVQIPHTHAAGEDYGVLPAYYHLPAHASPENPAPLVIIFTGLDGYRTELAVWKDGWAGLGVATLVLEIPGTGDNPGEPSDPESPDRVWSSMFDWIGEQECIDQNKVVNWGFSTGGYYSIRLAHTHSDKLKGVVALGGGCHHMFDPEWLDAVDTLEYPFDLAQTLCYKFGYETDFERFKEVARDRFSLLSNGILDRPGCARLLLVNGTEDEVFPIDDYYLCLQHGDPKEVRFVGGSKHMGEPDSFVIILQWLFKLLEIPGDVNKFLSTIPFKAKYLK